ncbi:hypothetical protein GN956_G10537 [Arapaima gigas]
MRIPQIEAKATKGSPIKDAAARYTHTVPYRERGKEVPLMIFLATDVENMQRYRGSPTRSVTAASRDHNEPLSQTDGKTLQVHFVANDSYAQ